MRIREAGGLEMRIGKAGQGRNEDWEGRMAGNEDKAVHP